MFTCLSVSMYESTAISAWILGGESQNFKNEVAGWVYISGRWRKSSDVHPLMIFVFEDSQSLAILLNI